MANGITQGIEDVLGIDTNAGTDELNKAIAALQAVGVPNADQLTLPELQKYVSAGVLTPQQYSAIQENPQAYQQAFQAASDTTGKTAQSAALEQLGSIVQNGGSTSINQANLENNINQTNQAMQAARAGIDEDAQQRGVSGGGLQYINKLMNEQSNAEQAHQGAVQAGSDNAQLALQALANQGTLGSTMQGQANQSQQAQAEAAAQIAQYNSQLQSAANQYNTQNANAAQAANLGNAQDISNNNVGNANLRTQYNAQIPQTIFQDQMAKAGGVANAYGNQAKLAQQQATNQNNFTGSLIGAGSKLGAAYLTGGASLAPQAAGSAMKNTAGTYNAYQDPNDAGFSQGGEVGTSAPCYAQGGEVHDHELCMKAGGDVPGEAEVPGDSPDNDTVPARLSPHEIVLPRSVSQAPNAPQAAAQFVGQVKQNSPMPMGQGVSSFAEALAKLEENGLELRLAPKGS